MTRPLLIALVLLSAACRNKDVSIDSDDVSETPDVDGDGVPADQDCDDEDPAVNPNAAELCDGVDNDCDGETDEDPFDGALWYADGDGDGYGAGDAVTACEAPEGFVAEDGDCDDADAAWYPGAPEDDCADPNDYNCDGSVGYADADGDGAAACEDCDDSDAAVFPGATEVCNDVDDDCDGFIDDADESLDLSSASTWYADTDGDGYGDTATTVTTCEVLTGFVADATDCDDSDAAVNPAAAEVCNGLDDDCDGLTDDADESVNALSGAQFYADTDGDGYGDVSSDGWWCAQPSGYTTDATDCDDGDAAVNPGATEVCNSVDDDCDGLTDDADSSLDASTGTVYYLDSDGDGYGDAASASAYCVQPSGYVSDATDCDDASGSVYPNATETCSGVDDDCDGTIDDPADLLGSDAACGAVNCNDILATRTSAPDGEYWLEFNGAPLEVYCDMTTSGGGWTVIHPDDIGSLGSLDAMRDDMDRAMSYLRDYSGNIYYTEMTQLAAYSSYDVDVSDHDTTRMRITFIPQAVASSRGAIQGMNSNGSDLTFTNCDGNGNSYIEFWTTGQSYTWNQDYTMSLYWRDSKLSASVSVPSDYFTFTAVHFGGCGTHSTSPYWVNYDNMQDAALAVR